MFSDTLKNELVDHLDAEITHISVHTAYSATGTNEATGGSYAREAFAIGTPSGGEGSIGSSIDITVPAGTYGFIGFWDALTTGNFKGMVPMGGGSANPPKPFFARNTGDVFVSDGHGFADDDTVIFQGPSVPSGITAGDIYYVVSASTNDFQVSLTEGGSAVTLSGDGQGIVQKIVTETFNAEGTLTVNTATLGFNLLT